jgi:hypothetical protein
MSRSSRRRVCAPVDIELHNIRTLTLICIYHGKFTCKYLVSRLTSSLQLELLAYLELLLLFSKISSVIIRAKIKCVKKLKQKEGGSYFCIAPAATRNPDPGRMDGFDLARSDAILCDQLCVTLMITSLQCASYKTSY